MNGRQILLIANYSARYSVRGGIGLVFLLLSLTFGLMVAHLMLQPVEIATKKITAEHKQADKEEVRERVLATIVERAKPVVSWMLTTKTDEDDSEAAAAATEDADTWAAYLLDDRPAMLSAIFLILLFGWPFLVSFGAFDLFAGDIGSRQLRYQLLRVDRGSIYFGRLLGMLITFAMVLALLGITVVVYMGGKLPLYSWGDMIAWMLHGTAAILIVSLPYVALCGWISAALGSSFASLTITSVIIGGVPLFAMIGRMTHEAAGYIIYALPWGYQTRLLHHDPMQVGLAALGCLGMTALFTWLGYRKFTRRDL
ncbi:MAG: hypothetical protein KDC98_12085 [Planctomycetes bacterium]|nr:hypothetical protein [Planctomycetota bacterium]